MKRRNFLKSLTAVCGAAVVCPGELLKPDLWIRAAISRKKNAALSAKLKFGVGERINHAVIADGFYNFNPFSESERKAYRERIHKLYSGQYYEANSL